MRKRLLEWLIYMSVKRRKMVLIVSVGLTIFFVWASTRIIVDMRWFTMLPETMPVVQEYKKIDANFYQPGNMIVAISGPDASVLEQITDEATEILKSDLVCEQGIPVEDCIEQERYARYVYGKQPVEWLTEHALRLVKPNDARRMKDLFSDPRLLSYITRLNDDFEAEYTDSENVKNQERQIVASLDAVQELVEAIHSAPEDEIADEQMYNIVRDVTIGNPYMFSLDRDMSLLMVSTDISSNDTEHTLLIDKQIEKLLTPLAEKYPDYRIERTGITAVFRDEMDSVGPVTTMITIAAILIVFLLLVWNFRSWSMPLFTLAPILIGIIWTTGIIGLTLGSMNLFTVMIMVILLGLGIDFSIHLASRFDEEIVAGRRIEDALRATLNETGKGVVTGALTTSVAFYTLMIADTKGIFEFGYCAGTGVIVTLLAVLWILPALLAYKISRKGEKSPTRAQVHDFTALGKFAELMGHWRFVVIPLVMLATAAGIWGGLHLEYEWNFNKLEPKGLRSVELQDEIIDKYKLSISASLLTTESIEESRELRKQFKEKRIVGDVDDISLWVSRDDFDKSRKHIVELREALVEKPERLSFNEDEEKRVLLADELDRLWANIVEIQALSIIGGQDRVVEKTTQLVASRENRDAGLLRRIADRFLHDDSINWQHLDRFAQVFQTYLLERATHMALDDRPVTIEMVPEDIRARYTSITGIEGYLMQILARHNLYEKEELELFQRVAGKIHPNVTGMPQMILNMGLETLREGKLASLAAIAVILLLLLIDFRQRPFVAVLAFLPLISGTAFMMGLMWLFGEKLNYVNMIAFPVIIGIGVDDGVHFFHRLIHEGHGGLGRAVTSVGRAMLMTSLTTMIGFGSLMLYLMEGMKSMGFVLFVGVGACFIVTVTLLPALSVMFNFYIKIGGHYEKNGKNITHRIRD